MSDPKKLDAFELDRLDLFATQILLQVLLHHVLSREPDPQALARQLAGLVDDTVTGYSLKANAETPAKEDAAREYLRTKAQELVFNAVARRDRS